METKIHVPVRAPLRPEEDPTAAFSIKSEGKDAVQAQSRLVEKRIESDALINRERIRSQLILQLGLYLLAALFVVVASLLVVFAPAGREQLTMFIGGALFILACGVSGVTFAKMSVKSGEIEVSRDQ